MRLYKLSCIKKPIHCEILPIGYREDIDQILNLLITWSTQKSLVEKRNRNSTWTTNISKYIFR